MSPVPSLSIVLRQRVSEAIMAALPEVGPGSVDPQLRRSDRADWQANGLLPLAKPLRAHPRQLAEKVVAALFVEGPLAAAEVSGPGFINLFVTDAALIGQVVARAADPRVGIGVTEHPGTTVIDYSQPNIAKEMHVGHLRSTVIGDALARILEHCGETVVRHNHLGDWGTQFGMLIQDLRERPEQRADGENGTTTTGTGAISRLNQLYRHARTRFDSDPDFAERSRSRVVALQSGDPDTVSAWREIVAESKVYFEAIYDRLGVLLTDEDAVGESFYNDMLADVCAELERTGVATRSDGALCVFFDDILGPNGEPTPLIVQKKDGGYGYATTDLAAIRYRVCSLHANRLLYVVDARQELHFRMVFAAARRVGWLRPGVDARHIAFGTVLGTNGRPFKTRSGDTVRLMNLLDEAVDHARGVVSDKSSHLTADEVEQRAREVGIGAVKYTDLSTNRTRDYVFDLDRMVSLHGNTSVYLQYAHARIQSILSKAENLGASAHPELTLTPSERRLALLLDDFADTLTNTIDTFEPHRLCSYLFDLAQAFTTFYETCPVLKADTTQQRDNRLLTCRLTRDTLRTGMTLLGVPTPDKL
ncbi:MAG: arginine--tRNA ligase [Sciscionella sp.]